MTKDTRSDIALRASAQGPDSQGPDSKELANKGGGLLQRFARNTRGNIAINFALAAIPLIAAAGVAVDLSRALIVRQRLTHALDAAGLAVGKTLGMTQNQMETLATDFFKANYPAGALGAPGPLSVNLVGNDITLEVTANVNTAILEIVGIDHLDVHVSNRITRATKGLELALVLDTTGSMADDSPPKIDSLKSASNQLLDVLFGDSVYPSLLKIGVVPFAPAVRVDPTIAVANNWIDTQGTNNSFSTANFSGGKFAYWLYTNPGGLSNTTWSGCVEQRPNRLDESDTGPSDAVPNTKWVPMFWPDEPHLTKTSGTSFNNDYISTDFKFSAVDQVTDRLTAIDHGMNTGDGPFRIKASGTQPGGTTNSTNYYAIKVDNDRIKLATSATNAASGTAVNITSNGSGTITLEEVASPNGANLIMQAIRQKWWGKYVGQSYSGTNGPLAGCGMQAMQLLTNDKTVLQNKIASLSPSGNTHVPVGLGWGWRIISPNLPGSGAVAYSNEDYIKAIVLMTDGANTENGQSNTLNRTDYTAYGYGAQQRMGVGIQTASQVQTEIDASMTRICTAIKALKDSEGNDRIRLYTIAFGTDVSTSQQNLLCNCAGNAEEDAQPNTTCPKKKYFYAPSGSELTTAFQTIATDLSNLRISH